MSTPSNSITSVPVSNYSAQITQFESGLLEFIAQCGLPTDQVFVSVNERFRVFANVDSVIERVEEDQLQRSIYISKFIAAASAGLFDAALNYMWDETIYELRRRVARYDLDYFYDAAVGSSSTKRKKLKTEEDLDKISDDNLIHGALEIGLISAFGFKHLEYVKYMRNWASAAHPNQNEITGLQLISMLETCVIEVITLPLSDVVVGIKQLLDNIKRNRIDATEAKQISSFFLNLPKENAYTLAEGFFGIFTQLDTTSLTRQNVRLLAPDLWELLDEHTKQSIGVKYARLVANNEKQKADLARDFLETVSGQSYIPDGLRAAEIQTAIEDLLSAHRGMNNFYTEPSFARQLQRLIGEGGNVPPEIEEEYVLCLVEVFLSNGNGIAHEANTIYKSMLDQLEPNQVLIAVLSFTNINISSSLQISLCQKQFRALISRMKTKVSRPTVKELVDTIEAYRGPLDRMKDDSQIERKVTLLRKMLTS